MKTKVNSTHTHTRNTDGPDYFYQAQCCFNDCLTESKSRQAKIMALPASPAGSSCSSTYVCVCVCFYDPFGNSLQRDHHAIGIIKVNLTPAHHLCVFFSLILPDNLVITQLLHLCACFHVSSTYLRICKGGNLHICSHLHRPDAFLRFNWQHIPECVCRPSPAG